MFEVRLFRYALAAAIAFSLVMALLPNPPGVPGNPPDKLQHMAAFAVMTGLGALAFPQASLVRLAVWLSALGALIELLQAIPALHRDCDIRDWVADTLAIGVVAGVVALVRRGRARAA